jgi:hydroxylamine reductase (hybrid-cluster protein)
MRWLKRREPRCERCGYRPCRNTGGYSADGRSYSYVCRAELSNMTMADFDDEDD